MKKQLLVGVSALVLTTACLADNSDVKVSKLVLPPKAISQHCLHSINAAGNFSLELRRMQGKACYSIAVRHASHKSVRTFVSKDNLYISSDNKHAKVIVYTKPIRSLNAYKNVSVAGDEFNNNHPLNLTAAGNSSIMLNGKFNVADIDQQSARPISVTWANSDTINIEAEGSGKINIAGVTQQLRARLYNNSTLNAEYLRANNAMIQSKDNANAEVAATDNLRAFAHNNSNIYFYKQPVHITRQSSETANILQLGWHQ